MSIDSQQPSMTLLPAACMAIGRLIAMPVAHAQTLGGASGPDGDATKGTLAVVEPQDAVIYGGEEKDGFLKVETSSGTARVKSIMMRKQ